MRGEATASPLLDCGDWLPLFKNSSPVQWPSDSGLTLICIVEHHDGRMEIIRYEDFVAQWPRSPKLTLVEEQEEPEAALVPA